MNKPIETAKRKTVLGISPGTRQVGIAVFRNDGLVDFEVKTFTGKITKNKLKIILIAMERIVNAYSVDSIVLKIPEGKTRSKDVRHIISDIERMSAKKDIPITKLNISDLKDKCLPDTKANKRTLAEYLMGKFPELSFVENSGLNRHTYYGKMFEAVAAGMQAE